MREQCRLLNVSPSSYYAWRKRAQAAAELTLAAWQVAAQRVFATHTGRYWRRWRAQLSREGHEVGRHLLRG